MKLEEGSGKWEAGAGRCSLVVGSKHNLRGIKQEMQLAVDNKEMYVIPSCDLKESNVNSEVAKVLAVGNRQNENGS